MSDSNHAFQFLASKQPPVVPAVCVLYGDEPLLRQESLDRIRAAVLSGDDGDLSLVKFDGRQTEARAVFDELATISMFGSGRRMVVVEDADSFVSKHRPRLEEYCDKPRSSSVLVLEVSSWPATTKLFKKLAQTGLQINCNLPKGRFGDGADEDAVLKWLHERASSKYSAKLGNGAAELLMDIVGPQLGRLDQELAKLALLAGSEVTAAARPPRKAAAGAISRELVEQSVGGWRAKTAWAMIDRVLDGNAREALVQLDRLLLAGEDPIALLAMMAGSLRRMATATRIVEHAEFSRHRIGLADALKEAGVKSFIVKKAEEQLRQIGRERAKKIFGWLLEADIALKSTRSSGERPRLVLEELIVRLSKPLGRSSTGASTGR
ncbi:MAG: DNA polymerase III subunit delta [Pirellulales bacterium]|nr:DNA polymerase III subunit delta [Pirellulales bacterium]